MPHRRLIIAGAAVLAAAAVTVASAARSPLVGGPPAQKPKLAVLLGANEVPDPGDRMAAARPP